MRSVMLIVLCSLLLLDVQNVHTDVQITAGQEVTHDHQAFLQETFDGYAVGSFPTRWDVRGDDDEARTVYTIVEGEAGNRFLRARTEQQDIQIGLSKEFEPKQFPVLQWRWRVSQIPMGGNERAKRTNDSAASVYVVFDSTLIPRAIKYVWSATLPVGTKFDSPIYWRAKVVVLQSGPQSDGEWRQETINFYQDYKTLFGFEPGEVQGIAVLTDSDTTHSVAEADYDDFAILSTAALSTLNGNSAKAPAAKQAE